MEACIEADEKGEALKYIPKVADPRERAEVIKPVQHILSKILYALQILLLAQIPYYMLPVKTGTESNFRVLLVGW